MNVHEAAKTDDLPVLQKWIDTEGDLDRKDGHDFTPLHWSCKEGKLNATKLLLKSGCDPNAINCAGDRPIHYATSAGHFEIVQLLVDNGAEVTIANDHGNTPLHYACFWRRKEIAEYLVEKGALVSASNKYGKTPLIRAGDALGALLREKAQTLGQNLQIVQTEVRDTELVAAEARAKFIAQVGIEWHVKPGTISFQELLCSPSAYYEVYRGEWTSYVIAIKKPSNQDIPPEEIKQLDAEVTSLRKLYHPNIHQILGGCIAPQNVCIFTEMVNGGSLFQLLHDPSFDMDQRQALKFAIETARGLTYLHEQQIAHKNLKSTNILVSDDLSIKISDISLTNIFNSSTNRQRLYDIQWMSPESLKEKQVQDPKQGDVYSYGVVFNEIVTRQIPFEGMNVMKLGLKIVLENLKPEIPSFVPKHLSQLMTLCWQDEPSKRPKMFQILPILEKC